jgi:hypothetical protein
MLRRTLGLAIAASIFVLTSTGAMATAQRTFVASHGNDANPCSLAQPCRGFGAAIAATAVGGEVVVLDSAGYGAVTITQAVSIIAPSGVYAGISVSSGDGVTVNAPGAIVVLRGLTINGQGGNNGIVMAAGSSLTIGGCAISNFPSGSGIYIGAQASVRVDNTTVSYTHLGMNFDGGATATVADSKVSHTYLGIYVFPGSGHPQTTVSVARTETSFNHDGVYANGNYSPAVVKIVNGTSRNNDFAGYQGSFSSSMTVSNSIVLDNASYGFLNTGATSFISAGNNVLVGNPTPTYGTITVNPALATY